MLLKIQEPRVHQFSSLPFSPSLFCLVLSQQHPASSSSLSFRLASLYLGHTTAHFREDCLLCPDIQLESSQKETKVLLAL